MFNSQVALLNALVQTGQVTEENFEKILISEPGENRDYMVVDKTNPTKPLGYMSVTYHGIQPGHGRVYKTSARFA